MRFVAPLIVLAAVYPIGAAEAMVLEAGGSDWCATYRTEAFSLGPKILQLPDDRGAIKGDILH